MSATATRPKLRPLDPLDLDGLLSDEDRLIAETVRRFAADRVLPHVEEWYEHGTFPARELGPEIGALGLLGMHLSGYGCAGASATSYGVACRELEAADSGLRSFVSVQGSLAMFPIWKFGSDEQKERWLPGMAAGELIGCFGLTEPDSGSDPASMKTRARRDGSDWVLSGAKMWITNGGVDLRDGAARRGGDLGVDLVGGDLDDRVALVDLVALGDAPLEDGALGDRLTHLGHGDLNARGASGHPGTQL